MRELGVTKIRNGTINSKTRNGMVPEKLLKHGTKIQCLKHGTESIHDYNPERIHGTNFFFKVKKKDFFLVF
jgi:hypothetical protein